MKALTFHLTRFAFLGSLIALALGINYVLAWTGPTQPAPAGNVDAPLNTGTQAQPKSGGLTLGSGASTTLSLTTEGQTRTRGWITVGDTATAATQPVDIRTPGQGIRFSDGTIQTSAATAFNPNAPLNLGSTLTVAGNTTLSGRLGFAGAAPSYAIDMDALPATSSASGIRFVDGTVQTTAYTGGGGGGGRLSAVRVYTANGTWNNPGGLSYIIVEAWGGGAGGEDYDGNPGTAGGNTTFGSVITANGGGPSSAVVGGVGGTATGGDINMQGGDGEMVNARDGNIAATGGTGGDSPRGGQGGPGGHDNSTYSDGRPGRIPGGGGGGAGDHHGANNPAGGGAGGYAWKYISSPAGSYSVTIGAGGPTNTATNGDGGAGGRGQVVVYEYQ